MKHMYVMTFGADDDVVYMPSYSMHRWTKYLANKIGMWSLICKNNDLAYMQGADPGSVHPNCVVDDFGNLVRVVQ